MEISVEAYVRIQPKGLFGSWQDSSDRTISSTKKINAASVAENDAQITLVPAGSETLISQGIIKVSVRLQEVLRSGDSAKSDTGKFRFEEFEFDCTEGRKVEIKIVRINVYATLSQQEAAILTGLPNYWGKA